MVQRPGVRRVLASGAGLGLVVGALGALTACRDAAATTATCNQYPIPLWPAETTRAAAQSELASMSPGASMTWNGNAGTLTSVMRLAAPLTSCTAGQDVHTQVRSMLAAHPALFQLDPAEWAAVPHYDCGSMGSDELLSMGRARVASRPVAKDVFTYSLKRIDGVVHLTAVNGTYLPIVSPALGDTMAACNTLTASAAGATARSTQLDATVFTQCQPTGTVAYTPQPNDGYSFATSETWSWEEGSGHALLTGQRTLRVTLNPANYTPELLSSNARCPTPDGDGVTVGFDIVFDVHSGAILSVIAGLDCIVC